MFQPTPLSCAQEGGAGVRVPAHAAFADVHALTHLLGVIAAVQFRDADPLLVGIFRFVGSAGQECGRQHD